MATQIAFHPKLQNPFIQFDLTGLAPAEFAARHGQAAQQAFETGKVLIFDNFHPENLEFFLKAESKPYGEWTPPLASGKILAPYGSKHCLKEYYDEAGVKAFQESVPAFEKSLLQFSHTVFPNYVWKVEEFSYRFNEMGLGFMHLDVPDTLYFEHQFRLFVNADWKPRILTIGPSFQELAEMFWQEAEIDSVVHLPLNEFIGEFRRRILDDTIFRFRELPRHYVTLDPGAMWLSHSSLISHGLVWGRKTICLESHIAPESMNNPRLAFANVVYETIRKHRRTRSPDASPSL